MTPDHDHDDSPIIRPRFDRRVLLASAAGLGLSAALGPLPEVWAKEAARQRRKRERQEAAAEKRLKELREHWKKEMEDRALMAEGGRKFFADPKSVSRYEYEQGNGES